MGKKKREAPSLVIRLGGLGDVIMTLGLLESLSKQGKKILFLTNQAYKELMDEIEIQNVQFQYTKRTIDSCRSVRELLLASLEIIRFISFSQFETIYLPYLDQRYRLLTVFSFFSELKMLQQKQLSNRYFGEVVINMAVNEQCCLPELKSNELIAKEKKIAIYIGGDFRKESGKNLRVWPVEQIHALCALLINGGYKVVLFGSKQDQRMKSFYSFAEVEFHFEDSFKKTITLFNTCLAVVTPDAGPLHLAYLTKTKVISLFGPTNWKERIPRNATHVTIFSEQEKLSCSPCYDGKNYASCINPICMKLIDPQKVYQAIIHEENSFSS
jgi:heptosyltransferase-2